MDITNLETFIEVAERKSFSRSAEALKLTQPAVSKRIAALEAELSARLFDRVGRTVHLTEAGRVLLRSAKQIRLELSRIEDAIDNLGNEVRGRLRIGTSEHIGSNHLPTILRSFHSNYPEVEIDLRVTSTAQTLASVENSSLELALCVMNGRTHRSLPPKLRGMEVWTDALQIVVAKNHPLATGAAVPLNVLIDTPAILAPITTPVRTTVDDELLAHELTATVAVEAGDFETMSSMTSMGLGWSCLPQHQVNDNLAVLDVQELKLKHSVALVRRDNRTLSRAAQAFLDSLRKLLGPGFNTTSPIEH